MYQAYDFTFDGISASMFGLFVCDIDSNKHSDNPFGNQANIIEERIAGRVKPLHYGVRYNDEPLSFNLVFGSENEMDRYQLQEIAKWLTGHQDYKWMSIDQPDLEHVQFRCLIQNLTPISVGWVPFAFEAKIVCDCPYGYGYEFETEYKEVSDDETKFFYNDGTSTENIRPIIEISVKNNDDDTSGNAEFIGIENKTTNTKIVFTDLPNSITTIIVDNENCIVSDEENNYDVYRYFNYDFLEFCSGDNELHFTGGFAKVDIKIRGRFLYNVGA